MKSFRPHIFSLLLLFTLMFSSCLDENIYNPDDYIIGEGESNVNVTVTFRDLEPALQSRAAGNAVGKVDNLWVVLYNIVDGEPVFYKKILANSLSDYKIAQDGNTAEPSDAETGSNLGPTGERTPKASFSLSNIPYGRYQLYAVANVPDLTDDDCATPELLKSLSFEWKTDVSENNAMFGYFTTDNAKTSQGFEAPTIILNQENINLHSWIKRLVSKVTVSFDASELNESVRIYIKSVTIHDIPKTCYLGKDNKPTDKELIANGEEFKYYTAETADNSQHEKWGIILSRGKNNNLAGATGHTEDDPALYFFENMQGNYPGQHDYLKEQIPDEVGTPIDKIEDGPDFKDRVTAGTYIEVLAYYESKNRDKLTSGPIIYRFMLGKDVTYNYNAERNFHYKLTLKFRGWANEADWHISYREYTPTLLVPERYYISYLYGQSIDFPVRVKTGDESVTGYTVKAEIIENNWIPTDPITMLPPPRTIGSTSDIDGFAWCEPAYSGSSAPYPKGVNYVGFLSLRPNEGDVIGTDAEIKDKNWPGSTGTLDDNGYGAQANKWLKWYYESHNIANNEYKLNGPDASLDPIDKSVTLKVPMYTRQKEMVPSSDFTGNNPFTSYIRTATVRFTLYDKDGKQVKDLFDKDGNKVDYVDSKIIQVHRIDNPKAIYRDENNPESFDVKLLCLNGGGASKYSKFISDGPWRASIMCQTEDFIKLTSLDNKTVDAQSSDPYIHGSTDEAIEFTYQPKGTCPGRTRCGIIMVEYNDYNCVHLIFVRQGYHQGVYLGDATWSCYNVYAAANPSDRSSEAPGNNISNADVALTRSPLSVGSFLKRCQYNYSIREANNDTYGWIKDVTGNLSCAYINANKQTATRSATWGYIQGYGWTNYSGGLAERGSKRWATTWTATGGFQDGKTFKVPTAANYRALLNSCKFGYGIAYADGATETADEFAVANGYKDYNNTGVRNKYGVRACVVYDETTGKNILFPLSALGQARRAVTLTGRLSYPGLTTLLNLTYKDGINLNRPLTYDVYRTPGAVYWIDQPVMTTTASNISGAYRPEYASWDINYLTLVFNPYSTASLGGWNDDNKTYFNTNSTASSDALPIKLIHTN